MLLPVKMAIIPAFGRYFDSYPDRKQLFDSRWHFLNETKTISC